jgi:uncharacterized protein DUF1064
VAGAGAVTSGIKIIKSVGFARNVVRHKFGNIRTEVDGAKFQSKKEARYYSDLLLAQRSGDLLFFLRQTPIHLKSGIRYVVDFVEFWNSGDVRFVDVKGFKTDTYRLKKKLVESEFPITIIEA